jgi:seryl-tRNA(Sec) selenium transferase
VSYLDESFLSGLGTTAAAAAPAPDVPLTTKAGKAIKWLASNINEGANQVADSFIYTGKKIASGAVDIVTATSPAERQAEADRIAAEKARLAAEKAAAAKKTQMMLLLAAGAAVALYFYMKKK